MTRPLRTALRLTGLLLLATLLSANGRAPVPHLAVHGALVRSDGVLSYVRAGKSTSLRMLQPVPYEVVTSGDYAVLTTCGADLLPTTWTTDGLSVAQFRGSLPLVIAPPICALTGLAADVSGAASGTVLLDSRGKAAWQHPAADLLWPLSWDEKHSADRHNYAYCLIPSDDAEPIAPYGSAPQLLAVQCAAGLERWRVVLPAREGVVDAQLYAIHDDRALLQLQYGYEDVAFFSLNVTTGRVKLLRELRGAVAMRATFPGPQTAPTAFEAQGWRVRLTVRDLTRGWRTLTFYLSDGTVTDTAGTEPLGLAEDNRRPVGGSSAPNPRAPLFPQGLLPTQHGENWSIPALVNAQGQVLVLSSGKAEWVDVLGAS